MTLASDSAQIEPPRDPASYRRPNRGGIGGAATAALCVLSVLAGAAVTRLAPSLFPAPASTARAPGAAPSTPALAAAPAPAPTIEAPPAPALAALEARVRLLEVEQDRAADAAASALASAALADAARTSRPFASDLASVERLLPKSGDVRALRLLAQTGAPSRSALAAEFPAAAARAASAANAPGENAGLWERFRFLIARVITARRVDQVSGDSVDAVLARAERLVGDGDIEAALAVLSSLPPKAQDALGLWRERARRRAEIDRDVDAVRDAAIADLTASLRRAP